jgi:hypothetical protein
MVLPRLHVTRRSRGWPVPGASRCSVVLMSSAMAIGRDEMEARAGGRRLGAKLRRFCNGTHFRYVFYSVSTPAVCDTRKQQGD